MLTYLRILFDSWVHLEPSWGHPVAVLRPRGGFFGPSWARLGLNLGRLGAILGTSWGNPGAGASRAAVLG